MILKDKNGKTIFHAWMSEKYTGAECKKCQSTDRYKSNNKCVRCVQRKNGAESYAGVDMKAVEARRALEERLIEKQNEDWR
jgi:hypothetical protein